MNKEQSSIIRMIKYGADNMNGIQREFYRWKYDNAKILSHVKTDDIAKQYPEIAAYIKHHKKDITLKQCYRNAARLCMYVDGVEYVEGEISFHGVPIEHAWNKIDGKYFDITKDILFEKSSDYAEYVSIIELNQIELMKYMNATGTYGGFLAEKFKDERKTKPVKESMNNYLKESPDSFYYEDNYYNYKMDNTMPFVAVMDKETENIIDVGLGEEGMMHSESEHSIYRDTDTTLTIYPGRLFYTPKVITFWVYPSFKELRIVLNILEEKLKINFLKDEWNIEIYENSRLGAKEYYARRNNEGLTRVIPLKQYFEDNIQTDNASEEDYIRHLLPPGAGKKNVPAGFGSKYPKYQSRRQWQMASVTDESKNDILVNRLFENPDFVTDRKLFHYNVDAMPFGFYKNKLLIRKNGTHQDLKKDNNKYLELNGKDPREVLKYPGRLWTDAKIISFWVYPPSKRFKWVIDKISKAIGEDMWKTGWEVETIVNKDTELREDPEDSDWFNSDICIQNKEIKFIPIGDYMGSEKRSKEELKIQHLDMSKKHEVPFGYGSKNPKYQSRRQWQMASVTDESKQEEYYPKLFENPNAINISKLTKKNHDIIEWDENDENLVFTYCNDEFMIAGGHKTHDIFPCYRGPCAGRLFVKEKIFTFWKFPENKEELIKIVKEIEKYSKMNILDDPDFKIEIPVNDNFKRDVKTSFQRNGWGTWAPKEDDIIYVNINDYVAPYERSKEELEIRHLLPPGAGKKEVPVGYGSKNPKYQSRRQWQMASVTDESLKEGSSRMNSYYEKNFGVKNIQPEYVSSQEKIVAYVRDFNGNHKTPIVMNPSSLNNFAGYVRAISDEDGNLYVVNKSYDFNHGLIANALIKNGIIKGNIYTYEKEHIFEQGIYDEQKRFLLLDRTYNEDNFHQSDTFVWEGVYTERLIEALRKKNPQFTYTIYNYKDKI